MTSLVDETLPTGPWEFDQAVTDVFDNMLERSIPNLDVMRACVTALAVRYAVTSTSIVDLGVSRGAGLAPIVEELRGDYRYPEYRFAAYDNSAPMLDAAALRFAGNDVDVQEWDLRRGYPLVNRPSVTLAVLTLQFLPVEYRHVLVEQACRRTVPGGIFILVEKLLGHGETGREFAREYRSFKQANGYSDEQIDAKNAALEGVLVPLTAEGNRELLRSSGFEHVECFWRWFNFAGFVGVKR